MQLGRQPNIPRQSLFLITTTNFLMLILLSMNMNQQVLVRSLSQVQSSRRTNVWIPFLHRSNAIIQVATQTSNIMMLPFRTLVTNEGSATQRHQQKELLTRTMVHRMLKSDLKDELDRRGLIIRGIELLKRPDLVRILLSEISKSEAEQSVNEVASTNDFNGYTNNTNSDDDIINGTEKMFSNNEAVMTGTPSSSTKYDVLSKKVGSWSVHHYPIDQLQIDPNTTYSIVAVGVTIYGKSGKGIGIVMRECNSNAIVWQAQKFYPGHRSIFESSYCAIILGLRFALQFFKLVNVQLHVPNEILLNQIMGNLRVTKPTLQLLLGQVTQLLKHHNTDGLLFQLADQENRLIASALAQNALSTRKSFNLGEDDNVREHTADPMLDFRFNADSTREEAWSPPKSLENNTLVLKFREEVKVEDVVIDPSLTYKLRFDGGSRGNPGVAGAGMVLYDDRDREIWRGVKYLGRTMSNNLAEYSALNIGLSYALSMGIERIYCEGDSQLVVKQLNGIYRVKSENLRGLFDETQVLINKFKSCQVHHIRREKNSRADELANQAMSTKSDFGFDKQMAG